MNLDAFLDLPVQWDFHRSTSPEQVVERIRQCDLIVTNKATLDRDNLASAKHLKLILIAATGTDNIDLDFCRSRQITVCNVRHYATPAVAQHTLGLILNLLTSQIRYTHDIRSGKWSDSPIFCLLDHPITELEGKTLGIIGYGVLGETGGPACGSIRDADSDWPAAGRSIRSWKVAVASVAGPIRCCLPALPAYPGYPPPHRLG